MGQPASNAVVKRKTRKKRATKPAAERKGIQIAVRLAEEEAILVKTEAAKLDMKLSAFVRHLIDEHMRGIPPHSVTSDEIRGPDIEAP